MSGRPICDSHRELAKALGFRLTQVDHPKGKVEYWLEYAKAERAGEEVRHAFADQDAVWQFLVQKMKDWTRPKDSTRGVSGSPSF